MDPYRVLFVCMGNICRSPAAEIICRKLAADGGHEDRLEIDSAGTIGYHAGKPPDSRMSRTLAARGYEITGRARQLRAHDLNRFDLVLVADQDNLHDARALDPGGSTYDKIQLLTRYCRNHEAGYVPDPYYGGTEGFEHVADLIEDACAGLLDELTAPGGPLA